MNTAFKNILRTIIFVVLTVSFIAVKPQVTQAKSFPPEAKMMLTMSAYGAAGGALLGFATMAFGTEPISIARGASLGLYAGILFGTYVIASRYYRKHSYYSAPVQDVPYNEEPPLIPGGFDEGEEENPYYETPQRWNNKIKFWDEYARLIKKRKINLGQAPDIPLVSMNLLNVTF